MKIFPFIVLTFYSFLCSSQQIYVDGLFSDWEMADIVIDDSGDYSGIEIEELLLSYDDDYLYCKISFSEEILIQQNNNVLFGVDFDDNAFTGFNLGEIGAELVFNFGVRTGLLYSNPGILAVNHNETGLVAAPTVSSNVFEFCIKRNFIVSGFSFEMLDQIAVHVSGENELGDQLPNSGKILLDLSEDRLPQYSTYSLDPVIERDFRFMSYNALRDNPFDPAVQNAFAGLMRAVKADVYCFQEVYDHDEDDVYQLLQDLSIIDPGEIWYRVKHGPDIITLSRYPIVFEQNIGNNGAVVIDHQDREVLIINTHYPCCENDFGREIEIDQILQFIRRSKNNQSDYFLEEGTPYIFCGDMNLVGFGSQLQSMIDGNIKDNSFFGPDVDLDWDGNGMMDLRPLTTGFTSAFTWYNPFGSFYPGRLDFIIYTDSAIKSVNSFVLNSRGLNQSEQINFQINDDYSFTSSDHMPVVSDFKFHSPNSTDDTEYKVSIFPNPTFHQTVYIESHQIPVRRLTVYSINGQLIKVVENPGSTIKLDLDRGLYILHLEMVNGQKGSHTLISK